MLDQTHERPAQVAVPREAYTAVAPQTIGIEPDHIRQGIVSSVFVVAGMSVPLFEPSSGGRHRTRQESGQFIDRADLARPERAEGLGGTVVFCLGHRLAP